VEVVGARRHPKLLAVLKYSFRAQAQETRRSMTADLLLEFRGLEAAVELMFFVMFLSKSHSKK